MQKSRGYFVLLSVLIGCTLAATIEVKNMENVASTSTHLNTKDAFFARLEYKLSDTEWAKYKSVYQFFNNPDMEGVVEWAGAQPDGPGVILWAKNYGLGVPRQKQYTRRLIYYAFQMMKKLLNNQHYIPSFTRKSFALRLTDHRPAFVELHRAVASDDKQAVHPGFESIRSFCKMVDCGAFTGSYDHDSYMANEAKSSQAPSIKTKDGPIAMMDNLLKNMDFNKDGEVAIKSVFEFGLLDPANAADFIKTNFQKTEKKQNFNIMVKTDGSGTVISGKWEHKAWERTIAFGKSKVIVYLCYEAQSSIARKCLDINHFTGKDGEYEFSVGETNDPYIYTHPFQLDGSNPNDEGTRVYNAYVTFDFERSLYFLTLDAQPQLNFQASAGNDVMALCEKKVGTDFTIYIQRYRRVKDLQPGLEKHFPAFDQGFKPSSADSFVLISNVRVLKEEELVFPSKSDNFRKPKWVTLMTPFTETANTVCGDDSNMMYFREIGPYEAYYNKGSSDRPDIDKYERVNVDKSASFPMKFAQAYVVNQFADPPTNQNVIIYDREAKTVQYDKFSQELRGDLYFAESAESVVEMEFRILKGQVNKEVYILKTSAFGFGFRSHNTKDDRFVYVHNMFGYDAKNILESMFAPKMVYFKLPQLKKSESEEEKNKRPKSSIITSVEYVPQNSGSKAKHRVYYYHSDTNVLVLMNPSKTSIDLDKRATGIFVEGQMESELPFNKHMLLWDKLDPKTGITEQVYRFEINSLTLPMTVVNEAPQKPNMLGLRPLTTGNNKESVLSDEPSKQVDTFTAGIKAIIEGLGRIRILI